MKTQRFVIASALEIVDERGVVRARLGIKGSDVIELDLFDRQGTIRSSSAPATTHITLKAPGGRERVIKP